MRKVELYEYYSFGFNYELLLNSSSTKTVEQFFKDLDRYRQFVREHNLKVTMSSLSLHNIDEDFDKLKRLNKGQKKKQKIPADLHGSIIGKIRKADFTLDAELNIEVAYILDNKRFSNEILTEKIEKVFSEGVFYQLPEIARFDFRECGKCLAFDRFTAAAFHALRGTEDSLKFYYSKLLNKVATDKQTWGSFYIEIDKESKSKNLNPPVHEELLTNLENLRRHYRNKTQHPHLIYSSDEVQDLFFLCIKTVNHMVKDLFERNIIVDDLPF